MSMVLIVIIAAIAAALIAVLVLVGVRASKLAQDLDAAERAKADLDREKAELAQQMAAMKDEMSKMVGWLDHQDNELAWCKAELAKRPVVTRAVYKILALGLKGTGKTSLTLKWANPLINLGTIEGTKIERYERSVSRVSTTSSITEHVFEVHDWGGEHLVDAHEELIVEEIHGLLIVVDLGGDGAKQVDMQRVAEQLRQFEPQALQYFFGPKTLASCKTVVLFINKSDLLPGTPAQVEEQAKRHYQPLIDTVLKYAKQIDVRVFVGSANYGHSTHLLFSHFVERILPRSAYDAQLLQRMAADTAYTQTPSLVPAVAAAHPSRPHMDSSVAFAPAQVGDTAPLPPTGTRKV